ncbi:unnamed protein product, partial [Allacma fusca]
NEFFDGLQANYRHAFVDMIATFQNITSTLAAIATKMDQMDNNITALSMELKDLNSRLIKNSRNFEKAELYEDKHFYGKEFDIDNMDGRNCFNADYRHRIVGGYNFINKASSIKLNGNCVRLYDRRGCTGKTLELSPGSREDCQKDLDNCNWNNITASRWFVGLLFTKVWAGLPWGCL